MLDFPAVSVKRGVPPFLVLKVGLLWAVFGTTANSFLKALVRDNLSSLLSQVLLVRVRIDTLVICTFAHRSPTAGPGMQRKDHCVTIFMDCIII